MSLYPSLEDLKLDEFIKVRRIRMRRTMFGGE